MGPLSNLLRGTYTCRRWSTNGSGRPPRGCPRLRFALAVNQAATPMSSAAFHGSLEKRSIGRTTSGAIRHPWRRRYVVLYPGELRWYEKAEVRPPGCLRRLVHNSL